MPAAQEVIKANDLLEKEDYLAALALVQPLVETGDPDAMALLGTMFQLGLGVEPNGPKAVELLTRASKQGVGVAAHNLGTIFAAGLPDVPADGELSRTYYRLAKELGAQFSPDSFYE